MKKYIDGFSVAHGKWIFTLQLGEEEDQEDLVFTPALAKALHRDLTNIIKKYEEKYGKISLEEVEENKNNGVSKKEEYS